MNRNRIIRLANVMVDGGFVKLTDEASKRFSRTNINVNKLMIHDINSAGRISLFDGQELYPEAVTAEEIKLSTGSTYFTTAELAVEDAYEMALERGYIPEYETEIAVPTTTETSRSTSVLLNKEGKRTSERLHIGLYKMPSGRFELTTYIN
jgi:hypothetical protein